MTSLFTDARLGTCECCESDEKPVVTFADEFGTTLVMMAALKAQGRVREMETIHTMKALLGAREVA